MQGIRNIPGRQRRLIINMKKIRDFLNKKRKGMTLIELMIVVVIIGIVFAYAFVNAGANTEKAKQARTAEDIAAITSAVAMYMASADDQATAITTVTTAATQAAAVNKYLSKPFADMKDGWGKAYSIAADDEDAKVIVIDTASTSDGKTDLDTQAFTRKLDFN
jgi:prepilin-type N-terminal cleavage/methylation domain-containing protein